MTTDKITTVVFRADFVKLFPEQLTEKDYKEDKKNPNAPKKAQYGLTMIFEPETDFTDMKRIYAQAVAEKWGNKPPSYLRNPFRRGEQKSEQYQNGFDLMKYPQYEGKVIVTASSSGIQPGVVAPEMDPTTGRPRVITDASEVYSGCYCRATLIAFGYENEQKGVAFGLQNVQKIRDGEPLAGNRAKAEDEFEAFVQPGAAGNHADLLGGAYADLGV